MTPLRFRLAAVCALLTTAAASAQEPAQAAPLTRAVIAQPSQATTPPATAAQPSQPGKFFQAAPAAGTTLAQPAGSAYAPAIAAFGQSADALYRYTPDGASATSSRVVQPSLVLFSDLSAEERKALTEDLQILASLLADAAAPEPAQATTVQSFLGVTVRGGQSTGHSIEYIEGVGIIYRLRASTYRFAPEETDATPVAADTEDAPESAWDKTRRELFETQSSRKSWANLTATRAPAERVQAYDPASMTKMLKQIQEVLGNVDRVHFPQNAADNEQSVIVELRNVVDGSVAIIRSSGIPRGERFIEESHSVTVHQYFDTASGGPAESESHVYGFDDFNRNEVQPSLYAPAQRVP